MDRPPEEEREVEARASVDRHQHPLERLYDQEARRGERPSPDLMRQLERTLAADPHDDRIREMLCEVHSRIANECDTFTGPELVHRKRAIELGRSGSATEWYRLGLASAKESRNLNSPYPLGALAVGSSVPCHCGKTHPRSLSADPESAARAALAYYDRALELDPTYVSALSSRAHMLEAIGRSDEARRDREEALSILDRAIEADASDKQSYYDRASVLVNLDRRQETIQDLERYLALETDDFWIEIVKDDLKQLREELARSQDGND